MVIRLAVAVCFVAAHLSNSYGQALRDRLPAERASRADRSQNGLASPAQPIPRDEPGYLGLITDDRRGEGGGILVVKVVERSPASAAGFRVDDVILTIDGADVRSLDQMAREIGPRLSGDQVRFEVRRSGEPMTLDVTLGRRPPRDEREFEFGRIPERMPAPVNRDTPLDFGPREAFGATRGQLLGVRTAPVTEEVRQRLSLREPVGAVVVSRVVGSPAERAGIPLDAVIVAVEAQPVTSPSDLARLIVAAGRDREIEIAYVARGEQHVAKVKLGEATASLGAIPADQPMGLARPAVPTPRGAVDQRIELLEGHVGELQQRVQELERLLRQRG